MTPTERALIKAVRDEPEDAASAAVYADWLEENGFLSRAKFIRDPSSAHALPEDLEWRAIVSHAPIATCAKPMCAKRWSAMETTVEDPLVRVCGGCMKPVRYCTKLDEVRTAVLLDIEVCADAALAGDEVRRALEVPRYIPLPANPPRPGGYREPRQGNVLTRLFGLFRRR
ncbi:MAG: TIGR02996 domain-containing protein [Deltaproteobacteria bacterium]|nr:TIGR02996 domain-containing protein [Deltaproteobacteria bacterium]MDQ3296805.1 TIGR02996 domain-containing protein [Myxococcota bacterium]